MKPKFKVNQLVMRFVIRDLDYMTYSTNISIQNIVDTMVRFEKINLIRTTKNYCDEIIEIEYKTNESEKWFKEEELFSDIKQVVKYLKNILELHLSKEKQFKKILQNLNEIQK